MSDPFPCDGSCCSFLAVSRIYYHGDSGPYGEWAEADPERKVIRDAWGVCEIVEIPDDVWLAYADADEARRVALEAVDKAAAEAYLLLKKGNRK